MALLPAADVVQLIVTSGIPLGSVVRVKAFGGADVDTGPYSGIGSSFIDFGDVNGSGVNRWPLDQHFERMTVSLQSNEIWLYLPQ